MLTTDHYTARRQAGVVVWATSDANWAQMMAATACTVRAGFGAVANLGGHGAAHPLAGVDRRGDRAVAVARAAHDSDPPFWKATDTAFSADTGSAFIFAIVCSL